MSYYSWPLKNMDSPPSIYILCPLSLGFASSYSINRGSKPVLSIAVGNSQKRRENCMHCFTPIEHLWILVFTGGPGTNLWIQRDNCNWVLGESKVRYMWIFKYTRGLVPLSPALRVNLILVFRISNIWFWKICQFTQKPLLPSKFLWLWWPVHKPPAGQWNSVCEN